jgi:hypothetical protein
MERTIKELWVKNDVRKSFEAVNVISTYKASFSQTENGVLISSEQIVALGYFDETGEIIEAPLNESIIKTLQYEKSGESLCFSQPDYNAGERE